MLIGSVSGNEIEDHPQAQGVRLGEQPLGVGERAIARIDSAEIGDVITGIPHRRHEEGVHPDRGAAQSTDVVQACDESGQIADAITIRILKTLRIDLIEGGLSQPARQGMMGG